MKHSCKLTFKQATGVTLLELLTLIALGAVLMAIAIPSYRMIMQNNRIAAFSSDFVRTINFARSEAVKRSTSVSICAAADDSLSSCGGSTQWLNGWLIFTDMAGDGQFDSSVDTLLKVQHGMKGQGTITAAHGAIIYNGAGFLSSGSGDYYLKVQGCQGMNGKRINIAASGRISVRTVLC